jgi:hypothetical protein
MFSSVSAEQCGGRVPRHNIRRQGEISLQTDNSFPSVVTLSTPSETKMPL